MAERDSNRKPTVVIIGAGLIGTSTAYWLSRSNQYQVVCIDKGPAPASATSKANAGRFCPSILGDFAPKLITLKSLLWRGAEGGVGKVEWSLPVALWGLKYLNAAMFKRKELNHSLTELGQISSRLMEHLMKDVIKLDKVMTNIWVYGDEKGLAAGRATLATSMAARFHMMDLEKCVALTSLSRSVFGTRGGCISVDSDYTANAKDFTTLLAKACPKENCDFKFNSRVENIIWSNDGRLSEVELQDGTRIPCNYLVLACGPWANQFMRKWFNVSLPIVPVRGASVQLEGVTNCPQVGFSDNTSGEIHFQVTPLGSKSLRLVGFAEVVPEPQAEEVEIDCSSKYREALIARMKVVMPSTSWKDESQVW